jgi:uncharacterized ubiquitin-like protein YukD
MLSEKYPITYPQLIEAERRKIKMEQDEKERIKYANKPPILWDEKIDLSDILNDK